MNKLFSKIAALSVGLAMAVGVGVAVGSSSKGAEVVKADYTDVYTLDCTDSSNQTTNNAYGKTGTATVDGIEWTFTGNGKINPWRLGGKTAQSGDQPFYTNTAIDSGVDKVIVEFGSLSGVTANSFEMSVHNSAADAASGDNPLESHTGLSIGADATAEIELDNQQSGKFYRFVPNLTISATSNKYLQLKTVTFQQSGVEPSGDTYKLTYNSNATGVRTVSDMPANVTGLEDGTVVNLTGSPTRFGYSFVGWGATAESTTPISSITIDGSNENVYAIWEEDHTVAGAWSDNPFTVAGVIDFINVDNTKTYNEVYVTGIVCQVDSFNGKYGSVTYWISDDGTTETKFEAYSGLGLNSAQFTSKDDVEVGATVVLCGNAKYYSNNSIYEYDYNNYMISYTAPSTGDIEVTFQTLAFAGVGDEGTYSASTDAANPSYSFSSDNSSVLSVASNGDWEAKAAGSATVRVDVTSDDGNGYKEVAVTVVEVKSVSEAYAIAAALPSGSTTEYSIKVSGFVSSLDVDGKARAINLTDGEGEIEAFFGGGNADYNTAISELIGGKVSLYGKVQNYSGTYELKDITLESVAQGDANSYGAGAYKSLDGSCETGVDAVTEAQWTAVSNGFNNLDASEQAEFRKDVVSGNVEKWVGRYTRIVSNTSLNDFMSLGIASSRIQPFAATEDSNLMLIVVITTIASVSAIAILLVIKRRKSSRK